MLALLTNSGLFLGFLSLWVFIVGLSPLHLGSWQILIGAFLIIFGLFLKGSKIRLGLPRFTLLPWLMVLVILASSFRIFTYSIFYPFVNWDTLAIYGLAAQKIFLTGSTAGFSGQPPFLSLTYTEAFFLSGFANEFFAKATPAILAILTIAATYSLGKTIFNQRVGLISAFLLSITPLFKIWAGAGYADIPGTFFFLMAMIFFYRREFLLTGIFTGLALWTKQSTLTLLISYPLVVIFLEKNKLKSFTNLSLVPVLGFLTGGFWYLKNFIVNREFFPAASSFWIISGRSIRNLLPFTGHLEDFGYWLAPVFAVSFLLALVSIKRKEIVFLLSFILPYLFIWWFIYSYETRFLLTILPIFTILAADFTEKIIFFIKKSLVFPRAVGTILILVISLSTLLAALDIDLLRERTFSLEQKREKFLGDAWRAFNFFKGKEASAIMTTDNRLLYFFPEREISQKVPKTLAELNGFNYLLVSPWAEINSQRAGWSFKDSETGRNLKDLTRAFESGDYVVYEIKN